MNSYNLLINKTTQITAYANDFNIMVRRLAELQISLQTNCEISDRVASRIFFRIHFLEYHTSEKANMSDLTF